MAIHFLNEDTQLIFEQPDKLLYKVLPLDRIMEVLEKSRWAFVSPTLWNDPFEKAFLEAEYKHSGEAFFLPIKPKKTPEGLNYVLFSSCFTLTNESEAFWKTYSPNGDGIRIAVNAMEFKAALAKISDYDVYIGKAIYETHDNLYKFQTDAPFWKQLKSKTVNKTHLRLLLKKRMPFEYENEIRILLLRKTPMKKSVAKIKMTDPKKLIKTIKLDPRIGTYMGRMIKEAFASRGFNSKVIRKSGLYAKPESTILFKKDIDLPASDIPRATLAYEIY